MDWELTLRKVPYDVYKYTCLVAKEENVHPAQIVRQCVIEWQQDDLKERMFRMQKAPTSDDEGA